MASNLYHCTATVRLSNNTNNINTNNITIISDIISIGGFSIIGIIISLIILTL